MRRSIITFWLLITPLILIGNGFWYLMFGNVLQIYNYVQQNVTKKFKLISQFYLNKVKIIL